MLEDSQSIDMANEELLKEIIEILNEIDSDIAYEFLDRFIGAVGEDNISQDMKDMLDSSNEVPSEPIFDPIPGKYIEPISVKLKLDKIKLGHSYYYTVDGTHPNKGWEKYRGQIDIFESTTIKLIGYNKQDDSTGVITLEYIIDENIIEDIEYIVKESEEGLNSTQVGTEVGNVTEEDKNQFEITIKDVKDSLSKDLSSYEEAINDAESLYNNSTEGSKDGQYKLGSKAVLPKSINNAKKINDNKLSKKVEIDNMVKSLNNAINTFKNSKISTFTKEKALQYATSKYGKSLEYNIDMYRDSVLYERAYTFRSNLEKENGKLYYKIEVMEDFCLGIQVTGSKVYEDGMIIVDNTFLPDYFG